jgi:hypothetical protein
LDSSFCSRLKGALECGGLTPPFPASHHYAGQVAANYGGVARKPTNNLPAGFFVNNLLISLISVTNFQIVVF